MGRKKFIQDPNLPYHVGARCTNRERFAVPLEKVWDIMELQLYFVKHAFNLKIHAFVLMPNHFHLLVSAPEANLSQAMRYFMTETSRALLRLSGRINQTYGSRYFRTSIPSLHYFLNVYKYLYRNPVNANLCSQVEDWPFSTLSGLLGLSPLLIPLEEDTLLFAEGEMESHLRWLNREPDDISWEEVRKALRKPEFKIPHRGNRASPLEIDML